MTALVAQPQFETEAAWLAERKRGIGGSDAAAILGLSKFRTPLQVYLDKIGQAPPIEETAPMRWGKKLEPLILDEYEQIKGVGLRRNLSYVHPGYEWMRGTLDAMSDDELVVEAKAIGFDRAREWGEEGSDYVPVDYLCQVQHYLAVSGRETADIAALFHGSQLKIYTVQADFDLIEMLTTKEAEFWLRVVNRNPPPPMADDVSIMRYAYPLHESEVVLAGSDHSLVDRYQALGAEISDFQKARDKIKAEILASLKGATIGLLTDGRRVKQTIVNKAEYTVKPTTYVQMTISNPKGK